MWIHVNRNGEQFGPYTLEDANVYLAQGSLLPTDEAWYEGASDWMPLTQVPGIDCATTPAAGVAPVTGQKSKVLLYAGISAGVLAVLGGVGFALQKKSGDEAPASEGGADVSGGKSTGAESKNSVSFANTAEPIFRKYGCYDCHSSKESNKVEANFDLSDRRSWRAFLSPNQPGNPATAQLVLALTATTGSPMPPRGPRLSDAEIESMKKWIVSEWDM